MAGPAFKSDSFDKHSLLADARSHWDQFKTDPDASLIRLTLLRDLIRKIHAEKSGYLARNERAVAQELAALESKLDDFKNFPLADLEFDQLLAADPQLKKRSRIVPSALLSVIPREQFERYDRAWETAIAAEACASGWNFWTLDAWVEISEIEGFELRLRDQIWPSAIILFVEAIKTETPGDVRLEGIWGGSWLLCVHPRFRAPDELMLDVVRWPGVSVAPSLLPRWRAVYTP